MKHIIIDGTNYVNIALYRASSNIKRDNPEKHDEWIRGATLKLFMQMCSKLQRENLGAEFYLVWDHPLGSKWRKDLLPAYKATRKHHDHVQMAIEVGKLVGKELCFYNIEIDNAEADDAIYALCNVLEGEKIIVSRDQDFIQIVQQCKADRVWDPVAKKNMEIPLYSIVDYKCLVGDTSDNIPGIKGIGPAKAVKLMEEGLGMLVSTITDEIDLYRKIISMRENPSVASNIAKAKNILANYEFEEPSN